MNIEELEKKFRETNKHFEEELEKMEAEVSALRPLEGSLKALEVSNEEFLKALPESLDRRRLLLEQEGAQQWVEQKISQEGGVTAALHKAEAEAKKIVSCLKEVSQEWSNEKPYEELLAMVHQFELLKRRWNQIQEERAELIKKQA